MRKLLYYKFVLACSVVYIVPLVAYAGHSKSLYKNKSAPVKQRVADLLGRMTLHEKVLQLQNKASGSVDEIDRIFSDQSYGTTHEMGMSAYDCAVMYSQLDKYMRSKPRLSIPVLACAEGIQGIHQDGCTLFPHALAKGCTFNPALIRRMTAAAGKEAATTGIRQALSPVLDIARDLRWGRIEETYGEDPFLIAEMGIASADGYQSRGIACRPQYIVAQGNPSGGLNCASVSGGERELYSLYLALGLLDSVSGDPLSFGRVVRNADKIALANQVADDSAMFLQNKDNILPLDISSCRSIAVVEPNSAQAVYGDYSWTTADTKEGISLLQGMRQPVGYKVEIRHAEGCDWWSPDTSHIQEAVDVVRKSDIAIVAIGTMSTYLGRGPRYSTSGEGFDLSSLELPGVQQKLLEAVAVTGRLLIVVPIAGKPLAIPWVKEHADALLVQWYAGEQQGRAMADILFGRVNPSGRLNVSFPRFTGNTPCFYIHFVTDREEPFDHPGTPDEPKEHYIFDAPDPLWNFGAGLSYTTFDYERCLLSDSVLAISDTIRVEVTVRNSGPVDGKEVVQLYVRDKVSTVAIPIQQLKALSKVTLSRGERHALVLSVPVCELSLFDADSHEIVEPGDFEIQIGAASDDIRFRRTEVVAS